jgi:hypothetical protein
VRRVKLDAAVPRLTHTQIFTGKLKATRNHQHQKASLQSNLELKKVFTLITHSSTTATAKATVTQLSTA